MRSEGFLFLSGGLRTGPCLPRSIRHRSRASASVRELLAASAIAHERVLLGVAMRIGFWPCLVWGRVAALCRWDMWYR